MIRPAELIQRKRDGEELTTDEISELIVGYVQGDVPDYQMSAFCMAVYFRGLSASETFALTEAMIRSGETIDLGAAIRLGASEANAGGRSRIAILADVCEAMIGAVFVDGGYPAAAALIERLWSERMRTPARPLRDSKTVLQEWAQARGLPTPAYREVERKGPDHNPEFRVTVELPNLAPAEGLGRSKRAAEQAAATAMLTHAGVKADRRDG